MLICDAQRSAEPQPAAIDANRRGLLFYSQGRLSKAIAAFRDGIAAQPALALLRANLATVLLESADLEGARAEFERALALEPLSAALNGLGSLNVREGRFDDARMCYQRVLERDPDDSAANGGMYELEQISGNVRKALDHQRRVLERKTLFTQRAPNEKRRLLALLVPGDWQANVPVGFLVDARTTTLHRLYIVSPQQAAAAVIPGADAVFTAIGESDESAQALRLALQLVRRIGLPHINDPRKILAANRVQVARLLAAIPHVHVPATSRMRRDALERLGHETPFPLVVRPVGSQAGRDLVRVSSANDLNAYLLRVPYQSFYVMPFIDFRSADGYYRKYRIVVVDGVPYPFHLAISPNWMIHYYNTPMRDTPWMRDEEARFLSDFASVFGPPRQQALRDVAQALGLEYFGIDCSIDADGRVLVFEADPAMVVHAGDDPATFGYKIPHAVRIFEAFRG